MVVVVSRAARWVPNLRAQFATALLAVLLAAFALAAPLHPALAQTTTGEVILTVSGGPDAAGNMISASFSLADLQAMPKTTFETNTMWTEGPQTFDGVDLRALLDMLKVSGGTLYATAINDYRIEMPIAEVTTGGPIIAYHLNGAPMSVRDKGPLWIVYPYDSNPDFQSEVVFSRSVWQLNRLEIKP